MVLFEYYEGTKKEKYDLFIFYLKTNLGIMRTFLKYQGISACDSYEIH